jgi:predicted MFS family arabinose efflux permease
MLVNSIKRIPYPWILVGLLWVVSFLNNADRQIIFSIFPLLQADFKLSGTQLGLLSTAFFCVYGVLSPLTGFLADRFGRRRSILASLSIWSLVTWATGHARNYSDLVWTRVLMGVSESCYLPAALALIADYHPKHTRSLATAIHQSGLAIGFTLGGIGGAWLGQEYGWRWAFSFLGGFGVIYALILTVALKEADSTGPAKEAIAKPRFLKSVKDLLRVPGYPTMLLVFTASSIVSVISYTWLPTYLYERFEMSLVLAGFSAMFYLKTGSLSGMLLGGWIADRWSEQTQRGRLFTQVIGLVGSAPLLLVVGLTTSHPLLILSLFAHGLIKGLYDCNAMPVMCQVVTKPLWSTGYGIFICAGVSTAGAMAGAAGYFKEAIGIGGALQLGALLILVAGVLLLRINISENVGRVEGVKQPACSN